MRLPWHGYPTPGDAYANEPANIVVNIVPWNEGGMNDVDFNGQHYLAADKSELVFYTSGAAKSLEAITDYPGGWKVTAPVPDFPDWLHVSEPIPVGDVSTGVVDKQTTLKLTADPLGSGTREGFFYIVAGNLKKKITVRQVDEEEFSLELSPYELTFYKTVTNEKIVTLVPVPSASPVYTLKATGNIDWETGHDPNTDAGAILDVSENTLSILPASRATGTATLGSSVLVTLTGAGGKSVTRVVNVKQLARDPLFNAIPSNPYPAGAGDYKFSILSELPWQVASSTELWLAVTDLATRAGSLATTYEYTFHLDEYPGSGYSIDTRTAYVNVESDDPDFIATTVSIVQTRAPYLVITDPASKEHDFGATSTPAPREVAFRTNAGWSFAGDANFSKMFSGATVNDLPVEENDPQTGSTAPTTEFTGTVKFTPNASAPAGPLTTSVTFTTANHGAVPSVSDMVTFYRLVPANWTLVGAKEGAEPLEDGVSSIAPGETTVTLFANTNLQWWGQAIDNTTPATTGTKASSIVPNAYTEDDPVAVTIPARRPRQPRGTRWEPSPSRLVTMVSHRISPHFPPCAN